MTKITQHSASNRDNLFPVQEETSELVIECGEDNLALEPESETLEEAQTRFLCEQISKIFFSFKSQYYLVNQRNSGLTLTQVKKIAFNRFSKFSGISDFEETFKKAFHRALSEVHDDPTQSVRIWDGTTTCRPDISTSLIHGPDMVSVNTWSAPEYRSLQDVEEDFGFYWDFLEWIMPHDVDRHMFTDWLAWCLQNEGDKPAWAIFLYSHHKGTGKSTLAALAARLFGAENTHTQNNVAKLTAQFNKPLLDSKLIISEEIQLKSDSPQANTLKTYITEKETTSEAKNRDVEKVQQCCCFLFTSNHFPSWIEADERRFYVIDVEHEGRASGPKAKEFSEFIGKFRDWMTKDKNIAALYHALMSREVSANFDAQTLNVRSIDTPAMRQLVSASQDVQLDRLREWLMETGVFAIPQSNLAAAVEREFKINPARLRHLMPELGWRSYSKKWGGKDHNRTIWVHSDYQVQGGKVVGPEGYEADVIEPDVLFIPDSFGGGLL